MEINKPKYPTKMNASFDLPKINYAIVAANAVEQTIIKIQKLPLQILKPLAYALVFFFGLIISPFFYTVYVIKMRYYRSKLNEVSLSIPQLRLEQLQDLITTCDKLLNLKESNDLKSEYNNKSVIATLLLYPIIDLMERVNDLKKQAEDQLSSDLHILQNGWDDFEPFGITPVLNDCEL